MNASEKSRRQDFLRAICQTSLNPIALEIDHAEGSCLYTKEGRRYLDFISGIGVANIGHRHPKVIEAIKNQVDKHLHVMVYGEYIQAAQVDLAVKLVSVLPDTLNQVYFTNSGTEANEGALKLAKKFTGRKRLIAFDGSFHGDTHGSCSVTGREIYRKPFEPLLPGITFLPFNQVEGLDEIDEDVAAVIIEPIQGEGGILVPDHGFLSALRARCDAVAALLIFDEAQTGFGRTGRLFAMAHSGVVPDIVTFAKGIGGGMPLGAFVGNRSLMATFSNNPPLSHVTTFGGHPVSCAAALASLNVILAEDLSQKAEQSGVFIRERLSTFIGEKTGVCEVRGKGMMIGLVFSNAKAAENLVNRAFEKGLILGWTLHTDCVIRVMPPLNISEEEMFEGLKIIEEALV